MRYQFKTIASPSKRSLFFVLGQWGHLVQKVSSILTKQGFVPGIHGSAATEVWQSIPSKHIAKIDDLDLIVLAYEHPDSSQAIAGLNQYYSGYILNDPTDIAGHSGFVQYGGNSGGLSWSLTVYLTPQAFLYDFVPHTAVVWITPKGPRLAFKYCDTELQKFLYDNKLLFTPREAVGPKHFMRTAMREVKGQWTVIDSTLDRHIYEEGNYLKNTHRMGKFISDLEATHWAHFPSDDGILYKKMLTAAFLRLLRYADGHLEDTTTLWNSFIRPRLHARFQVDWPTFDSFLLPIKNDFDEGTTTIPADRGLTLLCKAWKKCTLPESSDHILKNIEALVGTKVSALATQDTSIENRIFSAWTTAHPAVPATSLPPLMAIFNAVDRPIQLKFITVIKTLLNRRQLVLGDIDPYIHEYPDLARAAIALRIQLIKGSTTSGIQHTEGRKLIHESTLAQWVKKTVFAQICMEEIQNICIPNLPPFLSNLALTCREHIPDLSPFILLLSRIHISQNDPEGIPVDATPQHGLTTSQLMVTVPNTPDAFWETAVHETRGWRLANASADSRLTNRTNRPFEVADAMDFLTHLEAYFKGNFEKNDLHSFEKLVYFSTERLNRHGNLDTMLWTAAQAALHAKTGKQFDTPESIKRALHEASPLPEVIAERDTLIPLCDALVTATSETTQTMLGTDLKSTIRRLFPGDYPLTGTGYHMILEAWSASPQKNQSWSRPIVTTCLTHATPLERGTHLRNAIFEGHMGLSDAQPYLESSPAIRAAFSAQWISRFTTYQWRKQKELLEMIVPLIKDKIISFEPPQILTVINQLTIRVRDLRPTEPIFIETCQWLLPIAPQGCILDTTSVWLTTYAHPKQIHPTIGPILLGRYLANGVQRRTDMVPSLAAFRRSRETQQTRTVTDGLTEELIMGYLNRPSPSGEGSDTVSQPSSAGESGPDATVSSPKKIRSSRKKEAPKRSKATDIPPKRSILLPSLLAALILILINLCFSYFDATLMANPKLPVPPPPADIPPLPIYPLERPLPQSSLEQSRHLISNSIEMVLYAIGPDNSDTALEKVQIIHSYFGKAIQRDEAPGRYGLLSRSIKAFPHFEKPMIFLIQQGYRFTDELSDNMLHPTHFALKFSSLNTFQALHRAGMPISIKIKGLTTVLNVRDCLDEVYFSTSLEIDEKKAYLESQGIFPSRGHGIA